MPNRKRPTSKLSETRISPTWRALTLLFVYRLILVSALGFAIFFNTGPSMLGSSFPQLFKAAIVVYLGFVASSGLFLFWRSPSAEQQVHYAVFIDILAVTVLMHASGGIGSGLGLLIAVSIANASSLTGGRQSLLFAAIGALAVLTEQIYAQTTGQFPKTAYTQGGLLGITYFAVSLLAHGLSRRVQESERLARQRGLDLADMAQLNDYIIRHMNTGVLVVDNNFTIRLINDTAWHLLHMPEARAGDKLGAVLPELGEAVQAWLRDPNATQASFLPHSASREINTEFTRLGSGDRAGTLIFMEDGRRVSEQAQQMKLASLGRLTASIAHEIRNPLGAISHAGQLLGESPDLSRSDKRLTDIIQGNSLRVNDIIETVLQLSRRDGAKPEQLNLRDWARRFVVEFCRSRLLDPGLLSTQVAPEDLRIHVDSRQLQQVVGNLCDNALKYGAEVSHPVRIQIKGSLSPDGPYPILEVIDNGPGIANQYVPQIFEPFFTTGTKSTGLGLYIAKELCEMNHISIKYLPAPSGGSCFQLSFRAVKPLQEP